jgi:predicted dinucleotide-binding enzyme
MTAALMVDPLLVGSGDHAVFMNGEDSGAKEVVRALLRSFGWNNIIDLGDISMPAGPRCWFPSGCV